MKANEDINNQLMLKAAVNLWNNTLLKSYTEWVVYTKHQAKLRSIYTRMLYWRGMKIMNLWKKSLISSSNLVIKKQKAQRLGRRRVKRKYLFRWQKYTLVQRKIKTACIFQGEVYKNLSLGFSFVRHFIIQRSKLQAFVTWNKIILMEKKLSLADRLRYKNAFHVPLNAWRRFTMEERKRRYSDYVLQKHKSRVSGIIQEILS